MDKVFMHDMERCCHVCSLALIGVLTEFPTFQLYNGQCKEGTAGISIMANHNLCIFHWITQASYFPHPDWTFIVLLSVVWSYS